MDTYITTIMINKFTFFVCILNIFICSGQLEIVNTIKPEHHEIRGTKISMVSPKGFQMANNFMGFQQAETNSSIMVLDIPGPYDEVVKGLTTENLLKRGIVVQSIENFTLNGLAGILIKGEQKAYEIMFTKYSLAFGTDKETILINGVIPKDSVILEKEVKEALLSTVYNANKILSPLDTVDFEIFTNDTDFIFAKSMSNMLVYNRDGKLPSETEDKASLVIAKAFSKVEISDKKEFATNRIKVLPVQITQIQSVVPIEINGLSGYEIVADGVDRKTGKKQQAYQVMLFLDDSYYILFGSSENNFEKNLDQFKKIASTFRLK